MMCGENDDFELLWWICGDDVPFLWWRGDFSGDSMGVDVICDIPNMLDIPDIANIPVIPNII